MRHLKFLGAVLVIAGVLVLANLVCACTHPGWRAVAAVQAAGNMADDSLAHEADLKNRQCLEKHGAKTEGYAVCIAKHRGALLAWKNFARPAINSALQATVNGLAIADKVKLNPDFDWKAALKPAACALLKIVSEWKQYFGSNADLIISILKGGQSFVCEE